MTHTDLATEPISSWQIELSDAIVDIAFSPNGQSWAAATADGTIVWHDPTNQLQTLVTAPGTIATVAISADSCWLAAGDAAGRVIIWDCRHQLPTIARQFQCGGWIEHLTWHSIDPVLAIGRGGDVEVWEPSDSQPQVRSTGSSSIFDLTWHPVGLELAIAGKHGVRAYALDGEDRQLVRDATASLKAAWSPDGRYLAAGNFDRSLTILDRQQPEDPWQLQGCPGKIRQLAWLSATQSPCLAVASGANIVLWQLIRNQTTWTGSIIEGHQQRILALAPHPDLPILASGGADGYACLWSISGEIRAIFGNGIGQITALGWHPDGERLAIGDRTGRIDIYSFSA